MDGGINTGVLVHFFFHFLLKNAPCISCCQAEQENGIESVGYMGF